MAEHQQQGVVFPTGADGNRSTTETGRAVVAMALASVDDTGARSAFSESAWRTGYPEHFRRLVEAGLGDADRARRIAAQGIGAVHERMCVDLNGEESPLADWEASGPPLLTREINGSAEPSSEVSLPYKGDRLRGDELLRQVDTWVADGVVEPSLAEAVRAVVDNPGWLRCEGRTVAALGASSEMGPVATLLRWGARVAAVELPRRDLWSRLVETAGSSAGTLLAPDDPDDDDLGVDLLTDVPRITDWLTGSAARDGSLVVGNYVYADGALNVRVATAVDEVSRRALARDDRTALAFLATPTDVFAVPGDAVDQATARYEERSGLSKNLGRALRTVSAGRLLQRQYRPGLDPAVHDAIVPQQGPNYALAKRLQRWRATDARAAGATVSMNIAPPTRTRSVIKNRALAAAYAGAHRFDVQIFDPATSAVLCAILLVHDLHTDGGPRHDEPWQDEAYAAAHGGLWRAPFAPRSALGLSALLGIGATTG
ncbi:hypothetical protein KLP28_06855 [Nocardioidaceae bacterium]|nr:hypothetical protein KLP28_06855 [Nocardioidaceae bacterium]